MTVDDILTLKEGLTYLNLRKLEGGSVWIFSRGYIERGWICGMDFTWQFTYFIDDYIKIYLFIYNYLTSTLLWEEEIIHLQRQRILSWKILVLACEIFNTRTLIPDLFYQFLFELVFNMPMVIDSIVILEENWCVEMNISLVVEFWFFRFVVAFVFLFLFFLLLG